MAPEVKDPADTETVPPGYHKRVVIRWSPDDAQPAAEYANPPSRHKGNEWWRKGNPKRNRR